MSGDGWTPEDLEQLAQRTVDVADETFGPFPVQTPAEAMTAIEKGIFALRQSYEAARAELDFAKLSTTNGITAVERQLHKRLTEFLDPKR